MTRTGKKTAGQSARRGSGTSDDDVLAVLVDERNGREFYVSIIDTLSIEGREYSVMHHYEPDEESYFSPEIVIMRAFRSPDGDLAFSSIIDRQELDLAFEHFFRRYEAARFQK